jgi:hypothetical protein
MIPRRGYSQGEFWAKVDPGRGRARDNKISAAASKKSMKFVYSHKFPS